MTDAFEGIYARGMAYGSSNVRTDTMTFRFRDETFEFPTIRVHPYARYNGYFYEASIDDLRKLESEAVAEK